MNFITSIFDQGLFCFALSNTHAIYPPSSFGPDRNISVYIGRIATKTFCSLQGTQRMKPNPDFSSNITFSVQSENY